MGIMSLNSIFSHKTLLKWVKNSKFSVLESIESISEFWVQIHDLTQNSANSVFLDYMYYCGNSQLPK
jgi:hypothetical protein